MKKTIIILKMLILMLSGQNADSLIDHAVKLYEDRHLDLTNLATSKSILVELLEDESDNVRALTELGNVYFLLGDNATGKEEKLDLFEQGKEYSKKAMKLDDSFAEAHFWYMVNIGRIGQTKGVLNSLALVPEIKKKIDKVLELEPEHTGALDAKAMLYYELPGLLGGNLGKSIEALNQAISLDSNYTLLYVDMAKVYIKKNNYEKARWYLERALKIKAPTNVADHVLDDKPEAEALLDEIREK